MVSLSCFQQDVPFNESSLELMHLFLQPFIQVCLSLFSSAFFPSMHPMSFKFHLSFADRFETIFCGFYCHQSLSFVQIIIYNILNGQRQTYVSVALNDFKIHGEIDKYSTSSNLFDNFHN